MSGPAARVSRCRSTAPKMVVAWRWDWWRMRVAMDHAQGDMGTSRECSSIDGDLRFEALELIEEARVDLSCQHKLNNEGGTLSLLMWCHL
jgi:hypothetical protein